MNIIPFINSINKDNYKQQSRETLIKFQEQVDNVLEAKALLKNKYLTLAVLRFLTPDFVTRFKHITVTSKDFFSYLEDFYIRGIRDEAMGERFLTLRILYYAQFVKGKLMMRQFTKKTQQ